MTKLTKESRETTISVCVARTFKTADANLEIARTALADAVYEHAFADAEKTAKKLPKGWIKSVRYIEISCAGFRHSYSGNDPELPRNKLKLSRDRLEPCSVLDGYKVEEGHPAAHLAERVVEMSKRLYEAKATLRDSLTTLLYSVNTVEKLREVWPQGETYFPEEKPKVTALPVPHALTQKINHMMGIRA